MELNLRDFVQRQRFVNVIDFDENGHCVIVGQMDLFAYKECRSCSLMFNLKENSIASSKYTKWISFFFFFFIQMPML